MKYYLDTEFIEGFKKPIPWLPTIGNFNKPYHSIQLISIGIVAEYQSRSYYAISNEYNYNDASEWVKSNVINPIFIDLSMRDKSLDKSRRFNFHRTIGKSNKQIAGEIRDWILNEEKPLSLAFDPETRQMVPSNNKIEFYGYYSDYDWVLFCSLFGTMMDLPKGFPMYCIDLKQTLDEQAEIYSMRRHVSKDQILKELKNSNLYPKQSNEHNALDDAKWNWDLHKFLSSLK